MAFKVIEWLLAIVALVECFACCGPKFADAACMEGAALRAGYCFVFRKQLCVADLLYGIGRGNAVGCQLLFARFAHPVGCPCW